MAASDDDQMIVAEAPSSQLLGVVFILWIVIVYSAKDIVAVASPPLPSLGGKTMASAKICDLVECSERRKRQHPVQGP